MIPDDLIIASRSSEKPICRVKTEVLIQNDTFFVIDTTPRGPYLNGSTYDGPIYKGWAKCLTYGSLLGLLKLLNKCVTDQFRMALARRQRSLSISIINRANKNGCSEWSYLLCSTWDHLPCSAYWVYKIRFFGGVYQPYKAVTFLRVNIKPIRPTTSTSRAH